MCARVKAVMWETVLSRAFCWKDGNASPPGGAVTETVAVIFIGMMQKNKNNAALKDESENLEKECFRIWSGMKEKSLESSHLLTGRI